MNIEQLQAIVDQIYLQEPGMKHPTVKVAKGRCAKLISGRYAAHAHAMRHVDHKGMICFKKKILENRTDADLLDYLAHEMAHIRRPNRAHEGPKFQAVQDRFRERIGQLTGFNLHPDARFWFH